MSQPMYNSINSYSIYLPNSIRISPTGKNLGIYSEESVNSSNPLDALRSEYTKLVNHDYGIFDGKKVLVKDYIYQREKYLKNIGEFKTVSSAESNKYHLIEPYRFKNKFYQNFNNGRASTLAAQLTGKFNQGTGIRSIDLLIRDTVIETEDYKAYNDIDLTQHIVAKYALMSEERPSSLTEPTFVTADTSKVFIDTYSITIDSGYIEEDDLPSNAVTIDSTPKARSLSISSLDYDITSVAFSSNTNIIKPLTVDSMFYSSDGTDTSIDRTMTVPNNGDSEKKYSDSNDGGVVLNYNNIENFLKFENILEDFDI